jgi:hypothetical protein
MKLHPIPQPAPRFLLYQDIHSRITINVRFADGDVWLTQRQIALLFHTTRENVVQHIRNIYQRAELQKERTCKNFLQVQSEGLALHPVRDVSLGRKAIYVFTPASRMGCNQKH